MKNESIQKINISKDLKFNRLIFEIYRISNILFFNLSIKLQQIVSKIY